MPREGDGEAGFRFHIRDDDAEDFPWLNESYWLYETEAAIIANMMDPKYVGSERPVQTIEAVFDVDSEVTDGNLHALTCRADIVVLVDPVSGWRIGPRLAFHLVPDSEGILRIRRIEEHRALRSVSAEEVSWGRIKSLFR